MTRQHLAAASALAFVLLFDGTPLLSQTQPTGSNLAADVVDPTASIKTLSVQNRYSPAVWGIDDEWNDLYLQAGIPHEAFSMQNILRISIPYVTSVPSGERGLSEIAIFNIFLYPRSWGTLAVGGVASLNPNKGPGIDTFAMGPAIGGVLRKNKWTYGTFNQNLFSFGDISTSQIQPILAYTHSEKLSFAFGDAQYTIDWNKGRFVNVPISGQINYIVHIEEQPLRFFFNPQYNLVNEPGTQKWMLSVGASLIVR
jgi:hypothetical protein